MYFVEAGKDYPPGTIGIITHELSRYSDFSISLLGLAAPQNTRVIWHKGVEIASGLNAIIRKMSGDWLWILGDDHTFKADLLLKLLSAQKDIIAPVCSSRTHPWHPVVYTQNEDRQFLRQRWADIPIEQVTTMFKGAGTAGMLIRKHVLDAVGDPWFENGKTASENLGEDLWFCRKAQDKGFEVHVDTRLGIGHITPATIWPGLIDGKLIPISNFNGFEEFWVRLDVGMRPVDQATTQDVPDNVENLASES